jgi:hypothetical protein
MGGRVFHILAEKKSPMSATGTIAAAQVHQLAGSVGSA